MAIRYFSELNFVDPGSNFSLKLFKLESLSLHIDVLRNITIFSIKVIQVKTDKQKLQSFIKLGFFIINVLHFPTMHHCEQPLYDKSQINRQRKYLFFIIYPFQTKFHLFSNPILNVHHHTFHTLQNKLSILRSAKIKFNWP